MPMDDWWEILEKIQAIRTIYDEIGIPDKTRAKMNDYFDRAFSTIDGISGNEEAKRLLIGFAESLVKRER